MQAVRDGRLTLCVSAELINEISNVLNRPELNARFPALTPMHVTAFLDEILLLAEFFDPVPHVFTWQAHADDDHLFNLAIEAKAKYLVTWENRILKLGTENSNDAAALRQLAPDLIILTPKMLTDELRRQYDAGTP